MQGTAAGHETPVCAAVYLCSLPVSPAHKLHKLATLTLGCCLSCSGSCRQGDTAGGLQELNDPRSLPSLSPSVKAAAKQLLLSKPPPNFHTLSSWTYLTQLHSLHGKARTTAHPHAASYMRY